MKPIGSEKLQGDAKLRRILELSGISEQTNNGDKNKNVEFVKKANDGKTYAIVKENHSYFVKNTDKLKRIVESDFSYVGGEHYDTKFRFTSYADALKSLNNLFIQINDERGIKEEVNLFETDTHWAKEEGEEEDVTEPVTEKYVIRQPAPERQQQQPQPQQQPMSQDPVMDNMAGMDDGMDTMGQGDDTEGEGNVKTVQKLTGKLAYKLRHLYETQEINDDLIKYVMNSILSAIQFGNVDPEVKEGFINKINSEESQEQMPQEPNMEMPQNQAVPPPNQTPTMEHYLSKLLRKKLYEKEEQCEEDDEDCGDTKRDDKSNDSKTKDKRQLLFDVAEEDDSKGKRKK